MSKTETLGYVPLFICVCLCVYVYVYVSHKQKSCYGLPKLKLKQKYEATY